MQEVVPGLKKTLSIKKNFMLMTKDELKDLGIDGLRLKVATILRTKTFDIFSIFLIASYTILIFLYLAFSDSLLEDSKMIYFYVVELAILGIFVIEICLHLIAFSRLYLADRWNVFDMVIILLCLGFVFLDIFVNNQSLKNFLKVRGIFRLLRIFLLVRKLNALRVIRDIESRRDL